MARNGSGTMSIINSFSASTTIESSKVNANNTDIASEITGSLPRNGEAGMTGQLKADAGTVSAPGITFSNDLNLGAYRIGTDNLGVACAGAKVLDVSATGLGVTGALDVTGALTLGTVLAVAEGGTGGGTAADARTALGLAIGTDVQAYDADLSAIAALAKTDGNIIVGDGAAWVAESGATARTSLGLGTIATQAADNVAITGGTITGTATKNRSSAIATTSGTAAGQTGIPSWATEITMILNGVDMSGSAEEFLVQLGTSGGYVATGYVAACNYVSATTTSTAGMIITGDRGVSDDVWGIVTIRKATGNAWVYTSITTHLGSNPRQTGAGRISDLGGTLDRVQLVGSGGGTFTAGEIFIEYA